MATANPPDNPFTRDRAKAAFQAITEVQQGYGRLRVCDVDLLTACLERGIGHDFIGAKGPPLHLACRINSQEFFDACLSMSNIPHAAQDLDKALQLLATFGLEGGRDGQVVCANIKSVIQSGANINSVNADGDTALTLNLMNAPANEIPVMAGQLLQLGADPNLAGGGNQTPLITSALHNFLPFTQALLAAGADVNAIDDTGQCALHYAGSADITRLLVAAGARVDIWSKFGESPIGKALQSTYWDSRFSVRELLLSGSSLSGIDWDNENVRSNFQSEWVRSQADLKPAYRLNCLVTVLTDGLSLAPWAADQLALLRD